MNRVLIILQICLLSFVCQAQNLKMAQPGLFAGAWLGARHLINTISEGVQSTKQIEEEAQQRGSLFNLFKKEKSYQEIREEKRERVQELRQKIVEENSIVRRKADDARDALESELRDLVSKRAEFTISAEIYNPIEDMLNLEFGSPEQPVAGSYLVPGMWMAGAGSSTANGASSVSGTATTLKPQEFSTACKVCEKPFGISRWKYNCLTCGEVVCDDCSSKTMKTAGYAEHQRACNQCVERHTALVKYWSKSDEVKRLCNKFEADAKMDSSGSTGIDLAGGFLGALHSALPSPFDKIVTAAQTVVSLAKASKVNTAESRRLANRVARLSSAVIKLSTQSDSALAQRSATDLVAVFNKAIELLEMFQDHEDPDLTLGFKERIGRMWVKYSSNTITQFERIHLELTNVMNDYKFARSMGDGLAAPTVDEIKEGVRQELNHVVDEVRRVGSETGERLDQIASDLQRLQATLGSSTRNVLLDPLSVQVDKNTILGQGTFGTVYAGTLYGSIPVAVKEMTNFSGHSFEQLRREVELTMSVTDPKVVKVYGLLPSTRADSRPAIIMEKLGNSLESAVPKLSQRLKFKYTLDVIEGMAKVHSSKLTHFDLKPENIMLTQDKKRAKIIDFGISQTRSTIRVSGSVGPRGTFQYMAPEMFTGGKCGNACDVYSFGILLYELWTEEKAWQGRSNDAITASVEKGNRPATHQQMLDAGVPGSIAALIEACWRQDPKERPTFHQMEEIEDDFLESTPARWPGFLGTEAGSLSPHGSPITARPPLPSAQEFEQLGCDAFCQALGAQDVHGDILGWLKQKQYTGKMFIESGAKMTERMRTVTELDELHVDVFEQLQKTIVAEAERLRRVIKEQQTMLGLENKQRSPIQLEETRLRQDIQQRRTTVGIEIAKRVQEAVRQAEEVRRLEAAKRAEEARLKAAMPVPNPQPAPASPVVPTPKKAAVPAASAERTAQTVATSGVKPHDRLAVQNVSALEWELGRKDSSEMIFQKAQAYAASRSAEGWRLPTIWELYTLYQQRGVLGNDLDTGYFWSDTAVVGRADSHWLVDFVNGRVYGNYDGGRNRVRLVRG